MPIRGLDYLLWQWLTWESSLNPTAYYGRNTVYGTGKYGLSRGLTSPTWPWTDEEIDWFIDQEELRPSTQAQSRRGTGRVPNGPGAVRSTGTSGRTGRAMDHGPLYEFWILGIALQFPAHPVHSCAQKQAGGEEKLASSISGFPRIAPGVHIPFAASLRSAAAYPALFTSTLSSYHHGHTSEQPP
ncbi:hypothetical protein B0H19DRAFT_1079471 [Mycena capillaripes]|nr:hypothetical protein B0H19DRAFT_1079471 [Mycena capillaripes]